MATVVLSAISFAPQGDGVAVVSRMLQLVMQETWREGCVAVSLFPDAARQRASLAQRARFAGKIAALELSGRARWTLFTHAHLLRSLSIVPARLRHPYAVFLHGIEAWNALTPRDTQLLANARLRLANSRFTAARVMAAHPEIGPVVACPLALLPGGAGVSGDGRRLSEPVAIADSAGRAVSIGSRAVLIVGRMLASERYKGHDELIDAWPEVVRRVPDAQLVVVGRGDDTERLRARAARSPAGTSVVFAGFASDGTLRALYEHAAVFAMPSRGEGFGLVYLEAMAHGLPCIGSREDAAAEIIADGETGLLVDQSDVNGLADAIARVLTDHDLRTRMGQAGRRRLHDVFSFQQFSNRVVGSLRAAFEPDAARTANRSAAV